jgi:polyisoprenyl-teichoic acid--peptidoglycan teichoic acid transferase
MSEGSTAPERAQPASPKRRRRHGWAIPVIFLAVVLVAGVGVTAFFAYRTARSISEIMRQTDALPTGSRPPSAVPSVAGAAAPLNILLIGSDTRNPDQAGRSDSFIVLHINSDRKAAYFVSFPRDMWVAIPGHGQAKINAAYSWGRTALAVQTIETLTGARIDHVATTDFSDFVSLIDAVGGVTVDNPVGFTGIDSATKTYYAWPKGPLTLNGTAALAFSRQRHELPRGDLDRALRQRSLLKALTLKIASPDVLANPVKLDAVISSLGKYVTVDSQMTDSVIYGLAGSMRISGADQVSMLQAPITGFGTSADGQSIDVVDTAGIAALGSALQNDTMGMYLASHPK